MAEPEDEEDGAPESPPEGATCAAHGERLALAVCPICAKNACMQCWHPSIRRCHACLVRDVDTVAPKLAWEDPARGFVSRFFGTLLSAFSPDSTAPAFARPATVGAALFTLLTFTPFAIVSGIIPFTRTLLFEGPMRVALIGTPSRDDVVLDVALAAAMGLGMALLSAVSVAMPYVSLSRAYADRGEKSAPVRLMLYRLWLVPLFAMLFFGLPWLVPARSADWASLLAMVPLVLLLASMRSVARMGSGAGPIAALAIVMVPFFVMCLSWWIAFRSLAPFMPDQATLQAAAAAASTAPTSTP